MVIIPILHNEASKIKWHLSKVTLLARGWVKIQTESSDTAELSCLIIGWHSLSSSRISPSDRVKSQLFYMWYCIIQNIHPGTLTASFRGQQTTNSGNKQKRRFCLECQEWDHEMWEQVRTYREGDKELYASISWPMTYLE